MSIGLNSQAQKVAASAASSVKDPVATSHRFEIAGATMCVVDGGAVPQEDMFKPTHGSSNSEALQFEFSEHAEQWLTVNVLQPVLEDFVFNSFVPLLKRKHGLAIDRPEGTCVRLDQELCARLKQRGVACHLVVSSAPPFPAPGEVAAERYSHTAVLVPVATDPDGCALLDPALYLPRPIVLTKASAYTTVHVWPSTSKSDERAALKRGTRWKFVLDVASQRINVLADFSDAAGFQPFFHYSLRAVAFPSKAVNLQMMQERKRYAIVKMAPDASKKAQLLVHPQRALIEFYCRGAEPETLALPFANVVNAEFPVAMLIDWIGKARLRVLDLDDPLESISTVAAAVLALSTPLPSLRALNVMRDKQRARVEEKTTSYWGPIEKAGASFGSLGGVLLEVQPPWGDRLLLREKTVETRTYPFPTQLLGQRIEMLQPTAGEKPPVVIGSLVIQECFLYHTRATWDLDYARHKVLPSNKYSWSPQKDFYGWVVEDCVVYDAPRHVAEMTRIHRSFFLKL